MVASLSEALLLSDEARVVTTGEFPHRIVHTNKAWSHLTGFKFTDVVNRTNSFLKGPATEEDATRQLKAKVSNHEYSKVRLLNYDRDGNPFYNSLEVFPLHDHAGKLTHFCGVLQGEPVEDGSVAKIDRGKHSLPAVQPPAPSSDVPGCSSAGEGGHANKRPRRDRQHVMLADALNNSTDAVVMTQAQPPYAITHVNQPWSEMCGYTLEEVEGLSNKLLQGPETDQSLLEDLMASVRRGEPSSATLVNYKKGGERFVNQVKVVPVFNRRLVRKE